MKMNVVDDAFNLAKNAYGAGGHAEAKDRLHTLHPEATWDEVVDAYMRACALAEASYEFGEQCRDKKMTDADGILRMKNLFPGFTESTYHAALSYGYFISR